MSQFFYRARGVQAERLEGVVEADSQEIALQKLDGMGLVPIALTEGRQGRAPLSTRAFRRRLPQRDLATFTRQLADLLGAGVVLSRSLEILSRQTAHPALRHVVHDLQQNVREGMSFSAALTQHPVIFSPLYVHLVEAGEVSGTMETVLNRLADFGEREEELVSRVRSAMAYPLLILIFGAVTLGILLAFVVPRLSSLFEDFQIVLPLPTRVLLGISYFLTHFWWILLAGGAGLSFLWQGTRSSEQGRRWAGRMLLKIPLVGELSRRSEIARFGRTLGTLVLNGIPVLQGLEVVSKTVTNAALKKELEGIWAKVRDGSSLTEALTQSGQFPPFVTNMVAVGEESGALDRALFKVADAYDREVDRATGLFTTLLGPFLILTVAFVVGFIVVSMLLPIFEFQGVLR